jgi:spore coat polysaccharide biosynthesis protein SpsF
MSLGIFLQVRLSSSRLPRKALLPLEDKTIIEHCMTALSSIPADHHVILTDRESRDWFAPFAAREGYEIFVGDPENVLKRYLDAAEYFNVDTILRATGDNPLVSTMMAKHALALHLNEGGDYTNIYGTPLGTGVELARTAALAQSKTDPSVEPYDREHVMPYLYNRRDRFKIVTVKAQENFYHPGARVTLDTKGDYQRLGRIFEDLYHGHPIDLDVLCPYLDGRKTA